MLTTSINADGAMYNIINAAHDAPAEARDVLDFDISVRDEMHSFSLPVHDNAMLNLDNIEHHLENAKTAEPPAAHDALAIAATLINDAQESSKDAPIIKAVENKEGKTHVSNPNAPTIEHGGDHTHDTSTRTVEFAGDNHHKQDSHNDNHDDGTGLT